MLVIGLTGTIGSGKSTVAGFLRELGAEVIDADEVGHRVYLPGSAGWKEVVAAFGEGILSPDGTVDRRKLGDIVFNDRQALEKLDRITHPLIMVEVRSRLKKLNEGKVPVVVLEAAVLIEAGWAPLVDEVWVTTAPEEVIYQRLAAKRKLSRQQVRQRASTQLPVSEKIKCATRVIDTGGSLEELKAEITAVWNELNAR